MKPDISAPGAKVLSASSKQLNEYAIMSGTSMATPHVSGVLALIISVWRKNSVDGAVLNWQQIAAENGLAADDESPRDLTYDELYALITSTAVKQLDAPLGGGGRSLPLPGWPERDRCDAITFRQWPNTFYGHGLIDAGKAVRAAVEKFYQEDQ
jgi:subtilisin family serine protease